MKTFDNNPINLFTASIHQLTQVEGIGFAKACIIKATFGLVQKIESYTKELHPKITSTEDVVKLLAPYMRYLKQEEFRVLLLDSERRLIRYCKCLPQGSEKRCTFCDSWGYIGSPHLFKVSLHMYTGQGLEPNNHLSEALWLIIVSGNIFTLTVSSSPNI